MLNTHEEKYIGIKMASGLELQGRAAGLIDDITNLFLQRETKRARNLPTEGLELLELLTGGG